MQPDQHGLELGRARSNHHIVQSERTAAAMQLIIGLALEHTLPNSKLHSAGTGGGRTQLQYSHHHPLSLETPAQRTPPSSHPEAFVVAPLGLLDT